MPETTSHSDRIDLAGVPDPDVRRVLRQMHEHYAFALEQQQMEIEALLETLIDKRISSLGEFKLNVARRQEKNARSDRFHEAVLAAFQAQTSARTPA